MANFYNSVLSGEIQGGTTAQQMPNIPCALVKLKAQSGNAGSVYIGGANTVIAFDGITDAVTGFELAPGDETGWIPIDNLNKFWKVSDNNGDDLTYLGLL